VSAPTIQEAEGLFGDSRLPLPSDATPLGVSGRTGLALGVGFGSRRTDHRWRWQAGECGSVWPICGAARPHQDGDSGASEQCGTPRRPSCFAHPGVFFGLADYSEPSGHGRDIPMHKTADIAGAKAWLLAALVVAPLSSGTESRAPGTRTAARSTTGPSHPQPYQRTATALHTTDSSTETVAG
jgi:hypothetical protein